MQEPILKAVAMPPRAFWAPLVPAVLNFSVQAPIMFLMIAYEINPIVFIFTIILVHLGIVAYGVREPHLSNMLQAWGRIQKPRRNIYKSKGVKLAP